MWGVWGRTHREPVRDLAVYEPIGSAVVDEVGKGHGIVGMAFIIPVAEGGEVVSAGFGQGREVKKTGLWKGVFRGGAQGIVRRWNVLRRVLGAGIRWWGGGVRGVSGGVAGEERADLLGEGEDFVNPGFYAGSVPEERIFPVGWGKIPFSLPLFRFREGGTESAGDVREGPEKGHGEIRPVVPRPVFVWVGNAHASSFREESNPIRRTHIVSKKVRR